MTEELEEILEYLIDTDKYIEDYGYQYKRLSLHDTCQLLDYITNLQQENERLKEENKSYQEYPFIIIEKNGVICMKSQEINRLNNIINELEKGICKIRQSTFTKYNSNEWDNCLSYNDDIKPLENILNGVDKQ